MFLLTSVSPWGLPVLSDPICLQVIFPVSPWAPGFSRLVSAALTRFRPAVPLGPLPHTPSQVLTQGLPQKQFPLDVKFITGNIVSDIVVVQCSSVWCQTGTGNIRGHTLKSIWLSNHYYIWNKYKIITVLIVNCNYYFFFLLNLLGYYKRASPWKSRVKTTFPSSSFYLRLEWVVLRCLAFTPDVQRGCNSSRPLALIFRPQKQDTPLNISI